MNRLSEIFGCRLLSWGFVVAAGLVLSVLGTAGPALAVNDFCDTVTATECQVTTLHNLGAGGTFTVDRILHIFGATAELRTNAGSTLTLNIAGGSPNGLIIELGGKITGNSSNANVVGATININVGAGNVLLATSGATISATHTAAGGCGAGVNGRGGIINLKALGLNAIITTEENTTISVNGGAPPAFGGCPAGAITIEAPQGSIDIDGNVLAQSTQSGAGTPPNFLVNPPQGGSQRPGGGPIWIDAACNLTVTDTGLISSKGQDPGADLVHLEAGCDVIINGKVESTGVGHIVPGNPPNSCSNVVPFGASVRLATLIGKVPPLRADKDPHSTACVEVWAGNSLTINRDGSGNNGEINADTGASPGGFEGTSWIDLFARGDIKILNSVSSAVVHANGNGATSDNGGIVTVKSRDGNVVVVGLGIQANSTGAGGDGGTVDVEAFLNVDLRGGTLEAKGGTTGSQPHGGHIIVIAFTQNILSDSASLLDVTGGIAPDGVIDLCASNALAVFPPGAVSAGATVNRSTSCGAGPTFQSYVVLPDCPAFCSVSPQPGTCLKATVTAVLNPATGRFPGNLGPDVTVRLDLGQKVQQDGVNVATTDLNGDGYIIILVVKDNTGNLGGQTTENVVISLAYTLPFGLLACSVTVHAADSAQAAGHILTSANAPSPPAPATGNIFVMDLHGADSGLAGWLVEGNSRYMRNVGNTNSQLGIQFIGNTNTMHNGNAIGNTGVGVLVQGNSNKINDADAYSNGSHGFQVVGNSNVLSKVTAGEKSKGNTGDGIHVSGALDDSVGATGNQILESNAFANTGYGIFVVGNSNTLKSNDVGEKGKGNTLGGVYVKGDSNPLTANDAFANLGNGFTIIGNTNTLTSNRAGDSSGSGNSGDGFNISGNSNTLDGNRSNANSGNGFNFSSATGTGNKLKNNKSNESGSGGSKENGLCEYNFAESTSLDLGGNKKDNANFVGVGVPKKYLAGCYE